MTLTKDKVFTDVQNIFGRGLVVVVGSGASCALGLPGMTQLATHLLEAIPRRIARQSLTCLQEWTPIDRQLRAGIGLEEAFTTQALSESLSDLISAEIAERLLVDETSAIANILSSTEDSSFGKLFAHILKTAPHIDVVTTNYDRLLEVHAARSNLRVDSMFYGHTVGRFDPTQSKQEMFHALHSSGRRQNVVVRTKPHIRLSKPHGSLDWFTYNGQHFRSDMAIPGSRRIVAPGGDKYRRGYDIPFDQQRERANSAIDAAAALLFIGYGFNDDHLQTHIRERIREVPAVIVSRSITDNAQEFLASCPSGIGIEAVDGADDSSRITDSQQEIVVNRPLWNLDYLVKDVLGK